MCAAARSRGLVRDSSSSEWLQQKEGFVGECNGRLQARLDPGAQSLSPLSLCPYLVCPLVWPYSQPDFPEWRRSWPPAASGQAAEPSSSSSETVYLRLAEPRQNPQHLVSGPRKAQGFDVSSQKEFRGDPVRGKEWVYPDREKQPPQAERGPSRRAWCQSGRRPCPRVPVEARAVHEGAGQGTMPPPLW